MFRYPTTVLVVSSVIASLSTYLYVATAIAYRRRDNGLSYILLVLGVGIWNGMFAAQVLSARPIVKTFFMSLAAVGGLLAGLGWFLFAATASSTPRLPSSRPIYAAAAILVGLDVAVVVTTPVHEFFWVTVETGAAPQAFAAIEPRIGFWLHTSLLVLLFAAGTGLFAAAWREGRRVAYARTYTVAGAATVLAILASNVFVPGGLTLAPFVAANLTTTGWIQARRGRILGRLRAQVG